MRNNPSRTGGFERSDLQQMYRQGALSIDESFGDLFADAMRYYAARLHEDGSIRRDDEPMASLTAVNLRVAAALAGAAAGLDRVADRQR